MTDPFDRAVAREALAEQHERVARMREGLTIHVVVYLAVNVLLVVIWALTWTGHPWFIYPLLGWGIGLAAHAAAYRNEVRRERDLGAGLGGQRT